MNKSGDAGAGPGRRKGESDTRERLVDAARRRFMAEGYQAVSLRSLASEVGVDVAMISYFFGSKQGLFGEAMALPVNPVAVFNLVIAGDLEDLPERLLTHFLAVWDGADTGPQLQALAIAATAQPELGRVVREAVSSEIVEGLAKRIGGRGAAQRAAAFTAQITGLVFARYVLRLEPLASMAPKDVVRRVAPMLHAALER